MLIIQSLKKPWDSSEIFLLLIWLFAFVLGILGIVYSPLLFLLGILLITSTLLTWKFMIPILIFLPAILPFQPALNPSSDFDLASGRVVILFLASIAFFYVLYKKISWFCLSNTTIFILLFLAWSVFGSIVAVDQERFLRKILVYLSIFPIYFLLLTFLKKFNQWEKLFSFWSWSAFLVALIGLTQFASQFVLGREVFFKFWGKIIAPILYGSNAGEAIVSNPSWFVGTGSGDLLRAISTFPDPHMLAFYLGMSLPIQVALIVRRKSSKFFWLIPGVSLLTLLLTFSRGSYVGLAGVLLWLFLKLPKLSKFRSYAFKGALVGFIFIFSALFIAPLRERFVSILDVSEGSNLGRLEIWNDSFEVISKNPILGVGLGNYAFAVRPESKLREPIYAHNTYLDIASEEGLVGLSIWIIIVLPSLFPLFQNNCFSHQNFLKTAISLSVLWFSLHAFFETPLFSPQILPLFITLIAFGVFDTKGAMRSESD